VKHKADIVAIDEKETGLRATLSLGRRPRRPGTVETVESFWCWDVRFELLETTYIHII